jgi:hypothetical protein
MSSKINRLIHRKCCLGQEWGYIWERFIGRFDELVLSLVDYSLKVSEAYIPLVVRSAITNVVS